MGLGLSVNRPKMGRRERERDRGELVKDTESIDLNCARHPAPHVRSLGIKLAGRRALAASSHRRLSGYLSGFAARSLNYAPQASWKALLYGVVRCRAGHIHYPACASACEIRSPFG